MALRRDGGFPAAKGWDSLVWELHDSKVELGMAKSSDANTVPEGRTLVFRFLGLYG